jgi:2-dehydropantoate 2-reductase
MTVPAIEFAPSMPMPMPAYAYVLILLMLKAEVVILRYIIYGAGGVGGVVGGKLLMAGKDVVLIARGEHLRRVQDDGLKLQHRGETETLQIPAVSQPSEIGFRHGDAVILTMKSQDTAAAVDALWLAAGDQVPVVCCQNGVENERIALRRFPNVYAMLVILAANYLTPGTVETPMWPRTGVLDIGRYPSGIDSLAEQIAADLTEAGSISRTDREIMKLKYTKLHQNMVNGLHAICPPDSEHDDILEMLQAETEACFAAAGIQWATLEEFRSRNAASVAGGLGGGRWRGGSTWQSLERGAGSSEAGYLHGEIVLLGRLHGVPVPANEVMQDYVERVARNGQPPGNIDPDELRHQIATKRAQIATR